PRSHQRNEGWPVGYKGYSAPGAIGSPRAKGPRLSSTADDSRDSFFAAPARSRTATGELRGTLPGSSHEEAIRVPSPEGRGASRDHVPRLRRRRAETGTGWQGAHNGYRLVCSRRGCPWQGKDQ